MEQQQRAESDDVLPRDLLCCLMCEEEMKIATLLPCFHSFCYQCIESYVKCHGSTNETVAKHGHKHEITPEHSKCPECRTNFLFSKKHGNDTISDNFLVQRLCNPNSPIEKYKQKSLSNTCIIPNCSSADIPLQYCINCGDTFCQLCAELHLEEEETSSHKLESYHMQINNMSNVHIKGNNNSKNSDSSVSVIRVCCLKYDHTNIDAMYCVDCELGICADCKLEEHLDHRCAELSAVAVNFETKVEEPLAELDENIQTLNEMQEREERHEKRIHKNKENICSRIKERKQELVNLINEYESVLLAEVDKQFEKTIGENEKAKVICEETASAMSTVIQFTDNLITYGSDEEKVAMRKKIGKRIKNLCEINLSQQASHSARKIKLHTPIMSVESICSIFGELKQSTDENHETECTDENHETECTDSPTDSDLSSENSVSDTDNVPKPMDLSDSYNTAQMDNVKAASETQKFNSNVPVVGEGKKSLSTRRVSIRFHIATLQLRDAVKEFFIPSEINYDCVKGIGVNDQGDLVVGTFSSEQQSVYLIESRGIIRGRVSIDSGWNICYIAPNGSVSLAIKRGDNRYKIRVLKGNGDGTLVKESHIESYGLNSVTAMESGHVIVTSNRYSQICGQAGKIAKYCGNVAVYNADGNMINRITNDSLSTPNQKISVLEKPTNLYTTKTQGIFLTDAVTHKVLAFNFYGDLLFEYGGHDVYKGPDSVCTDHHGNVIVMDKKHKRIDMLTHDGQLKKTFSLNETPKFVSVTPENLLMVATVNGYVKFYDFNYAF